jgi:ABC-type transporter Mla subunit MlaD
MFVSEENSENLRKTIARAPKLMKKMESSMDDIQGTIDNMKGDWEKLAGAASEGISEGKTSIRQVTRDVSAALDDVRAAVNSASSNWNMTLRVAREHVDEAGGNVTELTGKLNEDWDYNQERLEFVLENMAELTRELKLLSRSLRERPWQIIHTPEEGALP